MNGVQNWMTIWTANCQARIVYILLQINLCWCPVGYPDSNSIHWPHETLGTSPSCPAQSAFTVIRLLRQPCHKTIWKHKWPPKINVCTTMCRIWLSAGIVMVGSHICSHYTPFWSKGSFLMKYYFRPVRLEKGVSFIHASHSAFTSNWNYRSICNGNIASTA